MAHKPNFIRKKKRKIHGDTFWDREYKNPEHLKLSHNPAEDLVKFTRWLVRQKRSDLLDNSSQVLDVGCGNGRNLIYLSQNFGLPSTGIDISSAALAQAKRLSINLPIKFFQHKAQNTLPAKDASQSLVLDMMTSHFLSGEERQQLRDEIYRVLVPGGFLFMKTFLRDQDLHTKRLIKDFPGKENGTYIHPVMGVQEYVYSEKDLLEFLREKFIIRKVYRSHKHIRKGKAYKRRTIVIYAEKDFDRIS